MLRRRINKKDSSGQQPSSGLDNRQATQQLCIRAEGEQNVKPAIVFRGKGNLGSIEKEQYDKR